MAEINIGVTQTFDEVVKELTSPNLNVIVTSHEQAHVLSEVLAERRYQDTLWGPAYERDNMSMSDWTRVITEYANGTGRAAGYSFEKRMIKVAALGVAAREWQIRNLKG